MLCRAHRLMLNGGDPKLTLKLILSVERQWSFNWQVTFVQKCCIVASIDVVLWRWLNNGRKDKSLQRSASETFGEMIVTN